jgi:cytochrome d ubiquinol oxidase subunit I
LTDATVAARWQFAFTIMFHYLFPVLTMGLGVLIAVLKTIEVRTRDGHYGEAARFWARIFAVTFGTGVVTGIPMEFQFGANLAGFSHFAGPVVAQTLFCVWARRGRPASDSGGYVNSRAAGERKPF